MKAHIAPPENEDGAQAKKGRRSQRFPAVLLKCVGGVQRVHIVTVNITLARRRRGLG